MDICIDVDGHKLNVRSAIVIIHNNKILLHKNINSDHYALLGGRVKIGESSENTIKRETIEEIGKEIKVTGYVATIENFFEMQGIKYHEILFIYKGEFAKEEDKQIEYTLKNMEGKENLKYEWISLNELEKYPLKPNILKEILKEQNWPIHKINNENK